MMTDSTEPPGLAEEPLSSRGATVRSRGAAASPRSVLSMLAEPEREPPDDSVRNLAVADVQRAVPALHPHEARAVRNWLISKGQAAATAGDAASRERLMLQLQDVEHQLDEIMHAVNADAHPELGHLPNASRSALKHWVTAKRSLLLAQLERVETAPASRTDTAGAADRAGAAQSVGIMADEVMAEPEPEDDLEGGDEQDEPEPEPEPRQRGREAESPERHSDRETPRQREPRTPRGDSAAKHGATTPGSARAHSVQIYMANIHTCFTCSFSHTHLHMHSHMYGAGRRTLRSSASRTAILETLTDDPTHVGPPSLFVSLCLPLSLAVSLCIFRSLAWDAQV